MKVTMPKEWKKYFTVFESEKAREIIALEKDDDCDVKFWAEIAATLASDCNYMEVLQCSAEVSKNGCISMNDRFCEESGNLDVYIRFKAFDQYIGFVNGGCYLSDLWDLCDDNKNEIREKMFYQLYTRK